MAQAEKTTVCVLTAKGMSAIASVALAGADAAAILENIFRTDRRRVGGFHPPNSGTILHGAIIDGDTVIDEVLIGCEAENTFVIHSHGNPLLVEQIVKLCQSHGATVTDIASFMVARYQSQSATMIETEARLALQTCAALSGAKLIANQLTHGLLPTVQTWLDDFDRMTLQELWAQCHQVLRKTSRGKCFINRCKIVLVGPPNSGKSTLLNCLAGNHEVIVTDTAGTTRDWVKITCHVGPLLADIYDTAGLDAALTTQAADEAAQQAALQLIRTADMNIFVYDATQELAAQTLLFSLGSLKAVIAANKCDLLTPHERSELYSKYIPLCAKTGDGVEALIQRLLAALKVTDFSLRTPVCFTDRQLTTLRQILQTKDKPTAQKHLHTLLFGSDTV